MTRPPEPPPEGVLIESAREEAKLSVREAARRAGISEGWWRQVVKGHQSLSGGAYGIVRDVPAETVAWMANATGRVSPDELTKAGREDAARELKDIQSRGDDAQATPERAPRTRVNRSLARTPALEPYAKVVELERAAGIPPRDDEERKAWDTTALSEAEKLVFIAMMRLVRDTSARESEHGTGLTHPHLAAVPGDAAGTRLP